MGRPRSATVYEAGPVRVTATARGYRLRWMELGVERESTASELETAKTRADSVSARVLISAGGAISGGAAFGALGDAWIAANESDWGAGHTANIAAALGGHVYPTLGRVACDRITDAQLRQVIVGMVAAGYSLDWISTTVRALRALCRWGVHRRVWAAEHDPASGLKVPKIDRLVNRTLIPTAAQLAELADAAEASGRNPEQALRRRWMIRAAAGTGIRWGEMVVLTAGDVDLEQRTVSIDKAWHEKEPPEKRLGPPKSRHSVRTVIIPAADVDLWRQVIEAADDGAVLAKPFRAAVWTSSYWSNKVWGTITADIEDWPTKAGYHFLRHYAITNWLDQGVPIGNASRLAGHHSAEFTMKRYVGPSVDYLDAARKLL